MQRNIAGKFGVESAQELQKLLVPVSFMALADDLALKVAIKGIGESVKMKRLAGKNLSARRSSSRNAVTVSATVARRKAWRSGSYNRDGMLRHIGSFESRSNQISDNPSVITKISVRQKNSWVDSGSGNLPSE